MLLVLRLRGVVDIRLFRYAGLMMDSCFEIVTTRILKRVVVGTCYPHYIPVTISYLHAIVRFPLLP